MTSTSNIEAIESLKREGNDEYTQGCKFFPGVNGEEKLRRACTLYGEAIQEMIEFEGENRLLAKDEAVKYSNLKTTIFLNLAMANLKLKNPEGARKCCNAVIMFCNNPSLALDEMGDTDEDVSIIVPIASDVISLVLKAVFRRGKCLQEMGQPLKALRDFEIAVRLCPGDTSIIAALNQIRLELNSSQLMKDRDTSPPLTETPAGAGTYQQVSTSSAAVSQNLVSTDNGGKCWLRRGLWSQSIEDVTVCIRTSTLHGQLQTADSNIRKISGKCNRMFKTSFGWSLEFTKDSVIIQNIVCDTDNLPPAPLSETDDSVTRYVELNLQYAIVPDECTWTIEAVNNEKDPSAPQDQMIILHLQKALPVVRNVSSIPSQFEDPVMKLADTGDSTESHGKWYPGCEWWDRVFVGDEAIDTTTCSIGADTSQLPQEARQRAQREKYRFEGLTEEERGIEIAKLVAAKKAMLLAESKTRAAAQMEDDAVDKEPERGELLEMLRNKLPNVDITAK